MLQNVWNIDKVNLDRNKNNKLDYILIEGEQTHFDAVRRTNGFLESSQNLPLNQLTNLSADWQRNLSSVKFSKLDTCIIQSAEAIICNNDDMALGVYDYYKQHKRTFNTPRLKLQIRYQGSSFCVCYRKWKLLFNRKRFAIPYFVIFGGILI